MGGGDRLVHFLLIALVLNTSREHLYLAGPPVMVEAASAMLTSRGARRQDVHADAFYTEAEKQALEAAAS